MDKYSHDKRDPDVCCISISYFKGLTIFQSKDP